MYTRTKKKKNYGQSRLHLAYDKLSDPFKKDSIKVTSILSTNSYGTKER